MSEPTPEAYEAAVLAYRTYRTHVRPHDPDGMREAIAAVWPLAEVQVRAKVAAEIRAEGERLRPRDMHPFDGLVGMASTTAYENAAKVAIGRWEFHVVSSPAAPPDEIYFVPQREPDETYDDWLKRCAVLKIDPAARIAEGKGDET